MKHILPLNLAIIGADNGLSPDRCQAIIWTNVGILLNGPHRKKLQWNFNRNSYIFIQENAFENVVCKMTAILFRPQYDHVSKSTTCYRRGWCQCHGLYILFWGAQCEKTLIYVTDWFSSAINRKGMWYKTWRNICPTTTEVLSIPLFIHYLRGYGFEKMCHAYDIHI